MAKPGTSDVSGTPPASRSAGIGGCLVRTYWMILGNAVLVLAAIAIAGTRDGFFSAADVVFSVIAITLAAARFVDARRLTGLTAAGEPATPAHLRRYLILLAAGSLALWALAHAWAHLSR